MPALRAPGKSLLQDARDVKSPSRELSAPRPRQVRRTPLLFLLLPFSPSLSLSLSSPPPMGRAIGLPPPRRLSSADGYVVDRFIDTCRKTRVPLVRDNYAHVNRTSPASPAGSSSALESPVIVRRSARDFRRQFSTLESVRLYDVISNRSIGKR